MKTIWTLIGMAFGVFGTASAQSQTWTPSLLTQALCGSPLNLGASGGEHKECHLPGSDETGYYGIRGEATASYVDLKAKSFQWDDAIPDAGYSSAFAVLWDRALISSEGLDGTSGTVELVYGLDGILYGNGSFISFYANKYTWGSSSWSTTLVGQYALSLGSGFENDFFIIDTPVVFTFDITFGEWLNYGVGLYAGTSGPGSYSDFGSTAALTQIIVKDSAGNRIDTSILSGSGTNLNSYLPTPAAVPEPSTWAMMILGFGVVGATVRRRKHHASALVRFTR